LLKLGKKGVDARDKRGHDGEESWFNHNETP